jgi:hypothetical protein
MVSFNEHREQVAKKEIERHPSKHRVMITRQQQATKRKAASSLATSVATTGGNLNLRDVVLREQNPMHRLEGLGNVHGM